MQAEKKKLISDLLSQSTSVEVMGTGRYSASRAQFVEVIDAVTAMRQAHPKAGAKSLAARITKVMNENGFPKFKVTAASITKWYFEETGKHLASDAARERGLKLKASRAKENMAAPSQIHDEPPAETPVQPAAEPIGLDDIADMSEEELAAPITTAMPLADAPDPFGGL